MKILRLSSTKPTSISPNFQTRLYICQKSEYGSFLGGTGSSYKVVNAKVRLDANYAWSVVCSLEVVFLSAVSPAEENKERRSNH